MLSQLILKKTLPVVFLTVFAFAAVSWFLVRFDFAWAFLVGGWLVGGSACLQVWLVGYLLDPAKPNPHKAVAGLSLVFKLILVGALLWGLMSRLQPHGVGLLFGMGAGLAVAVLSIHQVSMTDEAQAEMERQAAAIEEKEEDNNSETG